MGHLCFTNTFFVSGLGSILFAINIDNPDLNAARKNATTTINIPQTSKPLVGRVEEEPRPVIAGEESPPLVIGKASKPLVGRVEEEPRSVIAGEESPPLVIDFKILCAA